MLNQPSVLNYLFVYLYATVITNKYVLIPASYIVQMLTNGCLTSVVTPVVYWSLLNQGTNGVPAISVWTNVSVHGVSFFLMLIDVTFNRMKISIRMVLFAILTVVLYMFLAFIIFAKWVKYHMRCTTLKAHTPFLMLYSTGRWVYPFLRWSQGPITALWYFVVAIIVVLSFFIMILVHRVRDMVARKTGRAEVSAMSEKVPDEETHQDHSKLEANQSNITTTSQA